MVAPSDLDQREDRTVHPLKLKNVTTGGVVSVDRPGLHRKAIRLGIGTLKKAWEVVVGAVITATLLALGLSTQGETKIGPGPDVELSLTTLLLVEFVCVALYVVLWYVLVYRRWRWEGGSLSILGLVGPMLLISGLLAFSWWALF